MDYVLRLQALDGYQSKFNVCFNERFSRILCVFHNGKKGDNPHFHFCLTTDYKQQALRVHLKNHFNIGKGNKHLSLKVWDGDRKACSYLFHEGTEPVICKGFSEQEINDFKTLNDMVQAEVKRNAPAKIVEDATEYFMNKPGTTHQDIFLYIFNRLRKNGDWLPNKFQCERWIMRIEANLLTDKQYDSYLKRQYETWFGQYGWKAGSTVYAEDFE